MTFFHVLVDRSEDGGSLSAPLRDGYGSDLAFSDAPEDRPYVFTNFVTSLDGLVTYGGQTVSEARLISGASKDDQWLMGLLRGAADAVLVGAGTLRADIGHTWTAGALSAADAGGIRAWRTDIGRSENPLQCFVSASGRLDADAAVFNTPDLECVVFTTSAGRACAQFRPGQRVRVEVAEKDGAVDLTAALSYLRRECGVRLLLCEGGPRLFGQMLDMRLVDECFHTLSPRMAGLDRGIEGRLGITEGTGWQPQESPRFRLLSARTGIRDADHLFLRYRRFS